jgi:hypothetical protein
LLAANDVAPTPALALAVVVAAPPGNSAVRLADADPAASEPASPPAFSMHTWTTTSTDNETSTPVSVPNAGSNASRLTAPALSRLTVALAESPIVAAEPTPDGTDATIEATTVATTKRQRTRRPL